ncbi:hypothetical protein MLD38_003415 [Melastoma candidum]|uniref:Uncharacterized protein n=1 Tax=Melastoma candidum TaxID=119954 RepID=A0ACB9S1R4_9MYRT|nr:hypothetical protein MLD38_003415 [Melastoma candidum]
MASLTMAAASFVATSVVAKQPARSLVVTAKASSSQPQQKESIEFKVREEETGTRRDLVFAAVASAAMALIAKAALADDEPKPGTPDAKKKYAPVCVTMPTAKICHK